MGGPFGAFFAQKKASELYNKACDGGEMLGCTNLGYLYSHGKGVIQDIQKANLLWEKACNEGYNTACDSLGLLGY